MLALSSADLVDLNARGLALWMTEEMRDGASLFLGTMIAALFVLAL